MSRLSRRPIKNRPKHPKPKPAAKSVSPVQDVTRKIKDFVRLQLCVQAGGRCQFDGCNDYLLEHHVTLTPGNFAQQAHIVAFSKEGPRGLEPRPTDINCIENLMFLCPKCHKLIDDHSGRFDRRTLDGYKKVNEARIRHVTGLGPNRKTSVAVIRGRIAGQPVGVAFDEIVKAITPRYPRSKIALEIDLLALDTASPQFVASSVAIIDEKVSDFLRHSAEWKETGHISLFGLSSIPILAYLGWKLGNKIPLDVYQGHRDTEDWSWKKVKGTAQYQLNVVRRGTDPTKAALAMSLSGKIDVDRLSDIVRDATIYEFITAAPPSPTFLKARADLEAFRIAYQDAMAAIYREMPQAQEIEFFPAVPAPVAVLCGRELLPRLHPALKVYDYDKAQNGFFYKLTLNQ